MTFPIIEYRILPVKVEVLGCSGLAEVGPPQLYELISLHILNNLWQTLKVIFSCFLL